MSEPKLKSDSADGVLARGTILVAAKRGHVAVVQASSAVGGLVEKDVHADEETLRFGREGEGYGCELASGVGHRPYGFRIGG